MQMFILHLKVYVFSEQGNQRPVKMNGPSNPTAQNAQLQSPQNSAPKTDSRFLAKVVQPHKLFHPRPNNYIDFLKVFSKVSAHTDNIK